MQDHLYHNYLSHAKKLNNINTLNIYQKHFSLLFLLDWYLAMKLIILNIGIKSKIYLFDFGWNHVVIELIEKRLFEVLLKNSCKQHKNHAFIFLMIIK